MKMDNLMKKYLCSALLCLCFTSNLHANGDLNLGELTCNQFIAVIQNIDKGDKGTIRVASLTSFLYGYVAGQNDKAIFNTDELQEVLNTLKFNCKDDGEQKLITVLNHSYKKN